MKKITVLNKAEAVVIGISYLALIQLLFAKTYVIPALIIFACFAAHLVLVGAEKDIARNKRMLRKYQQGGVAR